MVSYNQKIVIIGTGASGLAAGLYLKHLGYTNIVFVDAADRVGGRLKTDHIDGYTLNHGFHTLNTNYEYANELLNYGKLELKPFKQGVIVLKHGKLQKISEALKRSVFAYKMIFTDVGKFSDRLKLIKKRIELNQMNEEDIFEKFEIKSSSLLKKKKFSLKLIDNFFKPYFSSFFLENELTTSRRMLEYTYKTVMDGKLSIPAKGIEAIPIQMASHFDKSNFILNTKVLDIKDKTAIFENGESIDADIFIIATDHNGLYNKIRKEQPKNNYRSSTCLYFSADKKPYYDPLFCVSANDPKLVTNFSVLTNIYKGFAPKNKELISVSINGFAKADDANLEKEVKAELFRTFGSQVNAWKLLKVYRIEYALPNQDYVLANRRIVELKLDDTIYACGDHLLYGNINGAIKSGRIIAEIIHRDLNKDLLSEKKRKYSDLFQKG